MLTRELFTAANLLVISDDGRGYAMQREHAVYF